MGEAQARLGLAQLRRLGELTAARRSLAQQYSQSMLELGLEPAHCDDLMTRLPDDLKQREGRVPSPHQVIRSSGHHSIDPPLSRDRPVFVRFPYLTRRRESLLAEAERRGLELGLWFESPIHPKQTNLAAMGYTVGSCPVAEQVSCQVINLPCHPGITPEDVARYVELLSKVER
jgi:dTDP-4-amino-4,6-dideoxygalactose transaminase